MRTDRLLPTLGGAFIGEFDGAGHTITGLTSTTGGLFASVGGSVHDLGIVGGDDASEHDPPKKMNDLAWGHGLPTW